MPSFLKLLSLVVGFACFSYAVGVITEGRFLESPVLNMLFLLVGGYMAAPGMQTYRGMPEQKVGGLLLQLLLIGLASGLVIWLISLVTDHPLLGSAMVSNLVGGLVFAGILHVALMKGIAPVDPETE